MNLNIEPSEPTYYDTFLNHRLTQKLKLVDEGKFNCISFNNKRLG